MINDRDKCKTCKGKKVNSESKILEVHVDKGMKDGQKLPFRGEGDQLVRIWLIVFDMCFMALLTLLFSERPKLHRPFLEQEG